MNLEAGDVLLFFWVCKDCIHVNTDEMKNDTSITTEGTCTLCTLHIYMLFRYLNTWMYTFDSNESIQTCVWINVHTQHSAACIQTYVMTNVHTQHRAAKTKLNLSGLDSVSVHLILS